MNEEARRPLNKRVSVQQQSRCLDAVYRQPVEHRQRVSLVCLFFGNRETYDIME